MPVHGTAAFIDKAYLPRVWVNEQIAQQLRELAARNNHPMTEEIRQAVRAHLKRDRRRSARHVEAAPGKGGSGTAARGTAAGDVCQPA